MEIRILGGAFIFLALSGSPALAQSATPQDASEPSSAAAKREAEGHYVEGTGHYAQKNFDSALAAFARSFERVPSPNSKFMVGRSLLALERFSEAYAAFDETDRLGRDSANPSYVKTAKEAAKKRDALTDKVGLVKVRASGKLSALEVQGRSVRVTTLDQSIPVTPGEVEIKGVFGGDTVTRHLTVAAGTTGEVQIEPPAPPPPPPKIAPSPQGEGLRPLQIGAIAAGGVGVVGMVSFAIFGGITSGTFSDLETACPAGRCSNAALRDEVDAGQTTQAAANVSLVLGLAGLAAGAGLFTYDLLTHDGEAEAAIAVVPTPHGILVRGTF